jgi:hypothetical protein
VGGQLGLWAAPTEPTMKVLWNVCCIAFKIKTECLTAHKAVCDLPQTSSPFLSPVSFPPLAPNFLTYCASCSFPSSACYFTPLCFCTCYSSAWNAFKWKSNSYSSIKTPAKHCPRPPKPSMNSSKDHSHWCSQHMPRP